jgi:RecA-family ATPase
MRQNTAGDSKRVLQELSLSSASRKQRTPSESNIRTPSNEFIVKNHMDKIKKQTVFTGAHSVRKSLLKGITRFDGKSAPQRQWIWENWVPYFHTTALYGDGGIGKSLLLQLLLTCAATGNQFLGNPLQRVKSVGFFCEDDEDELHRRQEDINHALGITYADLHDCYDLVSLYGEDNILMTFEGDVGKPTDKFEQIKSDVINFGAQLTGLDPVADLFGGNEVIRSHARQFVQCIPTVIAAETHGATIVTAHPSVRGLRDGTGDGGSTQWHNAVRSRMYMQHKKTEDDESFRTLTHKKSNYGPAQDHLEFIWEL